MKINLKTILKNVVFLLMMLKMCVVFDQQKRVVIDPGHGGKDSGAIGINGILEKDVVLNIAKEIVRLNKTILDDKFDVYLTRYRDTFVSLSDRSRLARKLNADIFVSLHCNASKKNTKGMEVYVYSSKTEEPTIRKSIALGLSIISEGSRNLGIKEKGVKFASFQVLRETIAYCPAILIETGFITNIDEADYFLKPSNIRAMALAIILGIYKY